MNKRLKIIDLFKILSAVLILTVIITIIAVKKIEKTNQLNQSVNEQKYMFEKYISKNQTSENTKVLLKQLQNYLIEKKEYPNMIPNLKFYGKDNSNTIILYTTCDKKQEEYYIKEVENIINSINSNDTFFIITESSDKEEYITNIIIEQN